MATRRDAPAGAADEAVVDLRQSTDDLVITSEDPLGGAAHLVEVLNDLDWANDELLQALVEAVRAHVSIAAMVSTEDHRTLRWSRILDEAISLERPTPYIGTFRKVTDEISRIAANLPDRDRTVASLLVLDRTAAVATNWTDFAQGVGAAMRTQPSAIVPATVVETVVRTCLPYVHAPPRPPAVAYGLPIAFDIIATSRTASLSVRDVWGLRAAVTQLEPGERTALLQRASSLNREDRRVVEAVLQPTPTTRRGRRHGRRR